MEIPIVRTRSLQEMLEEVSVQHFSKNLVLFRDNKVEEIRRACLRGMSNYSLAMGQLDEAEDVVRDLIACNDKLWRDFLVMYLFLGVHPLEQARVMEFVLATWPERDFAQRSKALCGRLNRALYYRETNIWQAGRLFVEHEMRAFYDEVSEKRYYEQEIWYRLERAVKLAVKAEDPWYLDTLRLIRNLYRTKQCLVLWEATDESEFPLLEAKHLAFIRKAIEVLNKAHRKRDRKIRLEGTVQATA